MVTDRDTDGWISDLVGSLTDPIIVMPGGWGDTLPSWIREEITIERMIENMKAVKGEELMGTDAEVRDPSEGIRCLVGDKKTGAGIVEFHKSI